MLQELQLAGCINSKRKRDAEKETFGLKNIKVTLSKDQLDGDDFNASSESESARDFEESEESEEL